VVDPRTSVINERLIRISRIIAVSSGKGGVGKSMVATALALSLAQSGCRVGLFDLDFTGPSTHIILGAQKAELKEEKGIVPPTVHGLEYMSLIYFVGDKAAPLRGADISNALIELLSVTQWGALDFLVIDMPPGIGDAVLDLVRLVKRIEFLIITTPSMLAFETVKKQANLLCELKMPIIGVVENMKMGKANCVQMETQKLDLKYLGAIAFDQQVEDAIGEGAKLMSSGVGRGVFKIAEKFILPVKKRSRDDVYESGNI
jgi:ATP-binding protein involved in chromosome partitioning